LFCYPNTGANLSHTLLLGSLAAIFFAPAFGSYSDSSVNKYVSTERETGEWDGIEDGNRMGWDGFVSCLKY
jgi:hypothetical protein